MRIAIYEGVETCNMYRTYTYICLWLELFVNIISSVNVNNAYFFFFFVLLTSREVEITGTDLGGDKAVTVLCHLTNRIYKMTYLGGFWLDVRGKLYFCASVSPIKESIAEMDSFFWN